MHLHIRTIGWVVACLVLVCAGAICDPIIAPLDGPTGGATAVAARDFSLSLPLFANDSAWNQRADQAAVLSGSDQQILSLYRVLLGDKTLLVGSGAGVAEAFPYMYVNHDDYSVPIFRTGTGQQTVVLRDYDGNVSGTGHPKLTVDSDGATTVGSPAGTVRPSGPAGTGADGHLVLYDVTNTTEYDYWAATTARDAAGASLGGGQPGTQVLAAGAIDIFNVTGSGVNNDGVFSARAMGTPLLAGMVLPEDVRSGTIGHALSFAIPGPRNLNAADPSEPLSTDYFYPASTTETDFYSTDPNALAAGQRIRLKQTLVDSEGSTIDETQLAPITRMFLQALRQYGAYLVDNAGALAFSAEDIHSANLNMTLAEVNQLVGNAADTALPSGKTQWQVVIETLNLDLEDVPVAYSSQVNQSASTATFEVSNFEVVASATEPSS